MDYTYRVDGSRVTIYDDQGDQVNAIVVTPGDPQLPAYLAAAVSESGTFTVANPE